MYLTYPPPQEKAPVVQEWRVPQGEKGVNTLLSDLEKTGSQMVVTFEHIVSKAALNQDIVSLAYTFSQGKQAVKDAIAEQEKNCGKNANCGRTSASQTQSLHESVKKVRKQIEKLGEKHIFKTGERFMSGFKAHTPLNIAGAIRLKADAKLLEPKRDLYYKLLQVTSI